LHQLFCASEDQRAQGKPGARRTRSLACKVKKHTSVITTGLPSLPGLPCAMVLRLTSRSPRRPGSFATVVSRKPPQNLTPASGRQDHTTSPSASASFVELAVASLMLPRPSHPVPNVRDDRETPLCVGRDGALIILIWVSGEAQYFCKRGWTAQNRFARQA